MLFVSEGGGERERESFSRKIRSTETELKMLGLSGISGEGSGGKWGQGQAPRLPCYKVGIGSNHAKPYWEAS